MGRVGGLVLAGCLSLWLGAAAWACQWHADGTMSFVINPASAGPLLASVVQPAIKCAVGLPFTVLALSTNAGGTVEACPVRGVLRNGAGQEIPYTISCLDAGVGLGVDSGDPAIELAVGGSVAAVDYENAAAGGYSDRVVFQITY